MFMDFGIASTSLSIVIPVVLSPEQDSKNASIGDGMAPVMTKAAQDIIADIIQDRVTIKNAVLFDIAVYFSFIKKNSRRLIRQRPMVNGSSLDTTKNSL